ncbi:ethanolamine ammonia-lyase light chain EutC, partial [Mycobacteroides abscessus subsp. abscessus]|nr:ethanolamine ammonia-lyase light chain EutC [Mycobacteroides abscessus subsp. abscessus]
MSHIANNVAAQNIWDTLRRSTQSRIGLGRSGDALPTTRVLEFGTAHAAARDAVHTPLDAQALAGRIDGLGLGAPLLVTSRATDRSEYLRRPDLGRAPADGALDVLPGSGGDIGIVLADGLSPRALDDHGVPLLQALHRRL